MAKSLIDLGIASKDIASIKQGRLELVKLHKAGTITAAELKSMSKALDQLQKELNKLKATDTFTKLSKDIIKSKDSLSDYAKQMEKTAVATKEAFDTKWFSGQVTNVKALTVLEGKLNDEIEKQARLKASIATQGLGGNKLQKDLAATLALMKKETAELEKSESAKRRSAEATKLMAREQAKYAAEAMRGVEAAKKLIGSKSTELRFSEKLRGSMEKEAKAAKKATSQSRKLTLQQQLLSGAVRGTAAAFGKLWLAYGPIGTVGSMVGIYALTASMKALMTAAYDAGSAFEYTTQYVSVLAEESGNASMGVGQIRDELLGIEGVTDSVVELSEGMKELVKAGVDVPTSLEGIADVSRLATIGQIDMAEAAKISVTTMNAFSKEGLNLSQVSNIIAKASLSSAMSVGEMGTALSYTTELSKIAGMSLVDVSASIATLANIGIKGSKAGTALRTSMVRLMDPSSKLTKMLSNLGAEFTPFTSGGEVKEFSTLMQELAGVMGGMTEQNKIEVYRELFGLRAMKGGIGIIEEFILGMDGAGSTFEKFQKELGLTSEEVDFLSGTMAKLSDTVSYRADLVKKAWTDALAGAFVSGSSEGLVSVLSELETLVSSPQFQEGITAIATGVGELALALAKIVSLAPAAMDTVKMLAPGTLSVAIPGGTQAVAAYKGTTSVYQWVFGKEEAEVKAEALSVSDAVTKELSDARTAKIDSYYKRNEVQSAEDPTAGLSEEETLIYETYQRDTAAVKAAEGQTYWKNYLDDVKLNNRLDLQLTEAKNKAKLISEEEYVKAVSDSSTQLMDAKIQAALGEQTALKKMLESGSAKVNRDETETSIAQLDKHIATLEKQRDISVEIAKIESDSRTAKVDSAAALDAEKMRSDAAKVAKDIDKWMNNNTRSAGKLEKAYAKIGKEAANQVKSIQNYADKNNISFAEAERAVDQYKDKIESVGESRKKAFSDSYYAGLEADLGKDVLSMTGGKDPYSAELEKINLAFDKRRADAGADARSLEIINAAESEVLATSITLAKLGPNLWTGFKAGADDYSRSLESLGTLGYNLAGDFEEGLHGTFSAALSGEFDTIGELWENTLDSMLDNGIDYVSDLATEFTMGKIVEGVEYVAKDLLGIDLAALGIGSGPDGSSSSPFYVIMAGGAAGEAGGVAGGALDTISTAASAIADFDAATLSGQSFDWVSPTAAQFASAFSDIPEFSGMSGEAIEASLGDFYIDLGPETDSVFGDLSETVSDLKDSIMPYVGMAAGAFGVYSGAQQFGEGDYLGGAVSTAGGAANVYSSAADAGLVTGQYAGTISTLTGAVGSLYGLYGGISSMMEEGVTTGNAMSTGISAISAYQTVPEAYNIVAGLFSEAAGTAMGDAAASALAESASIAASTATSTATSTAATTAATTTAGTSGMTALGSLTAVGAIFAAIEGVPDLISALSPGVQETSMVQTVSAGEYLQFDGRTFAEQYVVDFENAMRIGVGELSGGLESNEFLQDLVKIGDEFGVLDSTMKTLGVGTDELIGAMGTPVLNETEEQFGILSGSIETFNAELSETERVYATINGGLANSSAETASQFTLLLESMYGVKLSTQDAADANDNFSEVLRRGLEYETDAFGDLAQMLEKLGMSSGSAYLAIEDLYNVMANPPQVEATAFSAGVDGFAAGGITGGVLQGGSGTVDDLYLGTINGRAQVAMGGEHIMPQRQTKKYARELELMRADKYADGGFTPGLSMEQLWDAMDPYVRTTTATSNPDYSSIDSLVKKFNDVFGASGLTDYADSVRKINLEYDDTIASMKEMGASSTDLRKAENARHQELSIASAEQRESLDDLLQPFSTINADMSDMEAWLQDLSDSYVEALSNAKELNASEQELAIIRSAQSSEIQREIDSIMESVDDIIDMDTMSEIEYSTMQVNDKFDDMVKSLNLLGATTQDVADAEEARRIELEKISGSDPADYYQDLIRTGASVSTFGSQTALPSLTTQNNIGVTVLIDGNEIINDGELDSRIVDISEDTVLEIDRRDTSNTTVSLL